MREQISLLVDGEMDQIQSSKLIDKVIKDKALRKRWRLYQLIGGVIRNEVQVADSSLEDKIAAALEAEPTIIAPRNKRIIFNRYKKTLGLSIAASVVIAMVVALPLLQRPSQQQDSVASISSMDFEQAMELDAMLTGHGEFVSSSGLNGLVSYAKLVSSENDY